GPWARSGNEAERGRPPIVKAGGGGIKEMIGRKNDPPPRRGNLAADSRLLVVGVSFREGAFLPSECGVGFEVYLISFDRGQLGRLPRSAVKDAFGEHVHWKERDSGRPQYDSGRLQYDDRHWSDVSFWPTKPHPDPEAIGAVVVDRPVSDGRLWDTLHQI